MASDGAGAAATLALALGRGAEMGCRKVFDASAGRRVTGTESEMACSLEGSGGGSDGNAESPAAAAALAAAAEAAAVAAAAKANERKLRKSATDKARRVRQRELAAAAEIARAGSMAR